ncbi:MAG: hypothetical protein H6555_10015 [Lewinellaceae bacterium]|nr:hypothetical protein [Lewinellaceae bacterium]
MNLVHGIATVIPDTYYWPISSSNWCGVSYAEALGEGLAAEPYDGDTGLMIFAKVIPHRHYMYDAWFQQ